MKCFDCKKEAGGFQFGENGIFLCFECMTKRADKLGAASRTDRLTKIINTACDNLKKELIEMIGGENDETN